MEFPDKHTYTVDGTVQRSGRRQRGETVTHQPTVDGDAFLGPLSRGPRPLQPLAARKVNKVELGTQILPVRDFVLYDPSLPSSTTTADLGIKMRTVT